MRHRGWGGIVYMFEKTLRRVNGWRRVQVCCCQILHHILSRILDVRPCQGPPVADFDPKWGLVTRVPSLNRAQNMKTDCAPLNYVMWTQLVGCQWDLLLHWPTPDRRKAGGVSITY